MEKFAMTNDDVGYAIVLGFPLEKLLQIINRVNKEV